MVGLSCVVIMPCLDGSLVRLGVSLDEQVCVDLVTQVVEHYFELNWRLSSEFSTRPLCMSPYCERHAPGCVSMELASIWVQHECLGSSIFVPSHLSVHSCWFSSAWSTAGMICRLSPIFHTKKKFSIESFVSFWSNHCQSVESSLPPPSDVSLTSKYSTSILGKC